MISAVEIARDMTHEKAAELVTAMSSKTALRKAFDLAGIDSRGLERIQKKLDEYKVELDERREEEEKRAQAIESSRDEAIRYLENLGFTAEDLLASRKSKGPRKRAIYQVENEDGEKVEIEAAVAGKPPKLLAEHMNRTGMSREDCFVRDA